MYDDADEDDSYEPSKIVVLIVVLTSAKNEFLYKLDKTAILLQLLIA